MKQDKFCFSCRTHKALESFSKKELKNRRGSCKGCSDKARNNLIASIEKDRLASLRSL